jgi:hypothetical protein
MVEQVELDMTALVEAKRCLADAMAWGCEPQDALGSAIVQYLAAAPVNARSEGEKQAYLAENGKHGWTGRALAFEGGSLYLDKNGDGTLIFDDEELSFEPIDEDDARQYRGARVANSELVALRDYLVTAFPATTPRPSSELVAALRKALDTLDIYADPTGYTDSQGEQLSADDEIHPGLLARDTAVAIRSALVTAAPTTPGKGG